MKKSTRAPFALPSPRPAPGPLRKRGAQPGNQNARKHGFYSTQFTREELALIAAFVQDPTIDDELWMQRVLNHRLLTFVGTEALAIENLVALAKVLTTGTGRVSRLLRDRRILSGEAADSLAGAIAAALDEISTELGIDV